jgi:UDPglucose 6-dehydrogenase
MRLVVFGAGYVGLVTGTGLADLGNEVLLVDIDPERVRELTEGKLPIYEPGLGDLVHRNTRNGRLAFATQVTAPWNEADMYFLAVGTPEDPETGNADVSAVYTAAAEVAKTAKRDALVVVKSTVPVGTCDAVEAHIGGAKRHDVMLEVVSNPEFLREGDAMNDFLRPERIVLGVQSEHAREMLRKLYAPIQLQGERVVVTDRRSSELIKYASNSMLAMRVSFMNELSRLCHATGADIHSVRLGMGADSRIGKKFLYAGPGYGGSCFPKDVKALIGLGKQHGVQLRLAEATDLANDEQGQFLATLVQNTLGTVRGKRITFWGLAFKPETDDVRNAPALRLVRALLKAGASEIVGHDPEASDNFMRELANSGSGGAEDAKRVRVVRKDYDAIDGAHALVLLTEWRSYRAPNFAEIRRRLAPESPIIVDARNVWRADDVRRAGLRYVGIGVPATGSTVQTPAKSSRSLG